MILGGEGAIGKNVVDELVRNGIKKGNIERISGKSRYATAAAIAEKLDPSPEVVFFVYGGGYADALSISPVAAIKKAPIIYLTTSGELNADSAAYLARLKKKKCVKTAYCIGGSGVISDQMMQSVRTALDLQQEDQLHRIYGINRYDTSCAVYSWFGYSTLKGSSVCIATGKNFPDALAGGVLAAEFRAPLLLVGGYCDYSSRLNPERFFNIFILGGTGAVPDAAVKEIFRNRS